MSAVIESERIEISRRCSGYYLRWYYNGWHYWLFYSGRINIITEGEKYRTRGTRQLTIGSGQLTQQQCDAIRTILNTREIYIYTDSGWGAVRVLHSNVIVYDNAIKGYEIELDIIVGSRSLSVSGFSPSIPVPDIPPSYGFCETIAIGTQVWMCLNYDQNIPGSKVYDDDEANRVPYGGLYTWNQVMAPGFCPDGWHVPTLAEWQELIDFVGDNTDAGGILKAVGTDYWNAPNTGAVDTYDFDLRSTGWYILGLFIGKDAFATLWTATQDGAPDAYYISASYDSAGIISSNSLDKNYYLGVRLIKTNCFLTPVVATAGTTVGNDNFDANWNVCAGATEYFLDVSSDPLFGSFVAGFNNLSVGNVLTYNVTGLTPGVVYYYRLRAEGGSCSTAVSSNIVSLTTPGAMLVTSRGDGLGVAILSITVGAGCTVSLDGTAKFYSDLAGTLNESSSWTPTPGSLQTRYVRCPSGTANLLFNDVTLLQSIGRATGPSSGAPGWGYNTLLSTANIPRLTADNLIYFQNCINIGLNYQSIINFTVALANLSPNLVSTYLYPTGTVTGTTADIPASCTILGLNFTSNLITGDVSNFPAGLLTASIGVGNTITGDIVNLPSMTDLSLSGSNTLYGDVADIPATMQDIYVSGNNTITGDVADFPALLTEISIHGLNTVFGNITDVLDTVTRLVLTGNNTLTGDIVNFPTGITYFYITGNNTLSGGFTGLPNGIISFTVIGLNTINGDLGDLPPNITTLMISGSNTVNGSIASLPGSVTNVHIAGSNIISGTLADIPINCTTFRISGLNTISGDVGDMPENTTYLELTGLNTVSDYTGKPWTKTGYYFYFIPTGVGGLSSAEIDQLLIDIDNDCLFTGTSYKTINITGTNSAPTATSLTARNSLIAKGVSLTTN